MVFSTLKVLLVVTIVLGTITLVFALGSIVVLQIIDNNENMSKYFNSVILSRRYVFEEVGESEENSTKEKQRIVVTLADVVDVLAVSFVGLKAIFIIVLVVIIVAMVITKVVTGV